MLRGLARTRSLYGGEGQLILCRSGDADLACSKTPFLAPLNLLPCMGLFLTFSRGVPAILAACPAAHLRLWLGAIPIKTQARTLVKGARRHTDYRRFATAAEAIHYAVDELRTRRSLSAWMQVGEDRFNKEEINRLYDEMIILCARL